VVAFSPHVCAFSHLLVANICIFCGLKFTNFEEYPSTTTRGTARRFITVPVWLIETTVTLFTANVPVGVDEYSGTIVHDSQQQHSVTQL
jgi:hypothetical protein